MPQKRQSNKSVFEKIGTVMPVNKPTIYRYSSPEEKTKRNRVIKIGIIGFIIVVIITGLLLFSFFTKPPVNTDIVVPVITKPNVTESCDDSCFWLKAQETVDTNDCTSISNITKKQLCFVSISSKSLDACKQVSEYNDRKKCVKIHASTTQNIALCSLLEEADKADCILEGDACYYENESNKPLCKALNKNNASFCQNNDQCIIDYSRQIHSAEACSMVSSRPLKNACSSIVLDKDDCGNLPNEDEIDYCKQVYAIQTNKSTECKFIRSTTGYAVDCFAYFAEQAKKVSFCDGVEILKRWDCYKKYAQETGDLAGCIGIDKFAPIAKEHCFIDTGKIYGNPQACEYLTFDTSAREICFRAAIQDNTALRSVNCANITNDAWELRCYTNAAKIEKDISVCNSLKQDADVLFCRSNYQ